MTISIGDTVPTSPVYVGNVPIEPLTMDGSNKLALSRDVSLYNKIPGTVSCISHFFPLSIVNSLQKNYPFVLLVKRLVGCPFGSSRGVQFRLQLDVFDTGPHHAELTVNVTNPTSFVTEDLSLAGYTVTYNLDFGAILVGNSASTFSLQMEIDGASTVQPGEGTAVFACSDAQLGVAPVSIDHPTTMSWSPTDQAELVAGWTITGGVASVTGHVGFLCFLPTITTAFMPSGTSGVPYSSTLSGVLTGLPSWSVSFGPLPPGLSINFASGNVHGTPTTPGTYTFTAKLLDVLGNFDTKVLTIVIA